MFMNLTHLSDYTNIQEFTRKIADRSITFCTKPGLPEWDQITPSACLLADAIHPKSSDRVMNIGCHHGALSVILGDQISKDNLVILDNDQVALNCTERTLQLNGIHNYLISTEISLLPQAANTFSSIALDIPKGRKLVRHWLVESFFLLKTGGELFIAGANTQGIQSIIKDAQELFGNAVIVGYKKGNRCALVRKEGNRDDLPEWSLEPGIAPGTWITINISIKGKELTLFSLPGIFSHDRLDEGTGLLLETIDFPSSSRILDVGCGYGIVGLYAASQVPTSGIDLVDSNRLAIAASHKNREVNKLENVKIISSDLLDRIQDYHYHLIVSNPPFHAGKKIDYSITVAFLHQAFQALEPGGQLIIVANQFIRYDYLMKNVFGNSRKLAQTKRYHILTATKNG
jgi:16S rRNA (guanine1207-N2)-methyltransferase